MFVRKLKSKKGKTYIQVVDKSTGSYRVLKSFGGTDSEEKLNQLVRRAKNWIDLQSGTQELDFSNTDELIEKFFDSIRQMKQVGFDYLLGRIFDDIGFNKIDDELFKQLVICRMAYPKSKLKTTEYLYRYKQIDWSEDQVYRYLDKLYTSQKELVQYISYEHTLKMLNNQISVVFYDVTTLYFEIDQEDDLRKTGFSKEGKHQNPQIVLGLLVSKNGYPLAYEIFEGNKFEGHTMLPVLEAFRKKYNLGQLVIIADSGLLSKSNIKDLQRMGYEFILGARIKNESDAIRKKILELKLEDGQSTAIKKDDLKLIISYSEHRANKDRYNRERGLRRLEKQIRTGRLTKSSINNRGYNKFLKLEGELTIMIDKEKIAQDANWDGLKGYITNARLNKNQVIENYKHLWHVEKAFRVAKSDLKIRPVYHRLQRRIEAHICISFVAYKVYKELERQLQVMKADLSPLTAIEIAENIFEIEATRPGSGKKYEKHCCSPKNKNTWLRYLILGVKMRKSGDFHLYKFYGKSSLK
ncbi:MAG: IS1634 family transposase [Cytophagales bacterium]|nr:IS1634 family transposase [Cytophagales bacterium]